MFSATNKVSSKNDEAKTRTASEYDFVGKQSKGQIDQHPLNTKMPSDDSAGLSCVYNSESSAAKTILITNNYSRANSLAHNQMDSASNKIKKSSITIYTHNSDTEGPASATPGNAVVYDRINILINNHYDRPMKKEFEKDGLAGLHAPICSSHIKKEKVEVEEDADEDDADKDDGNCKNGLEVSTSNGNTKFAVGDDVLVAQNDGRFYLGTIIVVRYNQTLVKFDDGTERWSSFNEITKLGAGAEQKRCVVCKKTDDRKAVVKVCEGCFRGYHRECSQGGSEQDGIWYCKR